MVGGLDWDRDLLYWIRDEKPQEQPPFFLDLPGTQGRNRSTSFLIGGCLSREVHVRSMVEEGRRVGRTRVVEGGGEDVGRRGGVEKGSWTLEEIKEGLIFNRERGQELSDPRAFVPGMSDRDKGVGKNMEYSLTERVNEPILY